MTLEANSSGAFSEARLRVPTAGKLPFMASALLFGERDPGAGTIVHYVRDLRATRAFWTTLGWAAPKGVAPRETASSGDTWARLDFSSAIAQWRASMILIESNAAISASLLDGAGFRCLSFVTSDLTKDGEHLRRAGASATTGRMDYVINGKNLALEIFAGPDGAMIELLEVKRARS